MNKPKVINMYGGPGSGKSTMAALTFAELKMAGYNTELIQEYAKDATWERRGSKVFAAQEYIFGKQHFRMSRVACEVEVLVTDSPLLMNLVYVPNDFPMPSLRHMIQEAYDQYDNMDVFINRTKPFQQAGRNQDEGQARELDEKIAWELGRIKAEVYFLEYGRNLPGLIFDLMKTRGWTK